MLDVNRCAYRSLDGKMCAVGCLISDEYYDPRIEGEVVPRLVAKYTRQRRLVQILKVCGIDNDQWPLLAALQSVHDTAAVDIWAEGLKKVAKRFGLNYNF